MTKQRIKFSKFSETVSSGNIPEQYATIGDVDIATITAESEDFGLSFAREYKVTGYTVCLFWRSPSLDNEVVFDVERKFGHVVGTPARRVHTNAKNFVRDEFAKLAAFCAAFSAAVAK